MNRTQQLSSRISEIAANHSTEIKSLSKRGPQGGSNAKAIEGWSALGNHAISRAARLAGVPCMSYWSGSSPTPSTAIPSCIAKESLAAYREIFK